MIVPRRSAELPRGAALAPAPAMDHQLPMPAADCPRARERQIWAYVILCTVYGLMMVAGARPPRMVLWHSSKRDITNAMCKKAAYEAFPQWALDHPAQQCPASFGDLTEYLNTSDVRDPWGGPYELRCVIDPAQRVSRVTIRSSGEDGQFGSDDDLRSDD